MICECNEKPLFKDQITDAEVRRIIDIYFKSSFTTDREQLDNENFVFYANPIYKTKDFQEQHKYALFKILADQHKIYYHEKNSVLQMPNSIKLRTQNYLEQSCDVVQWFKENYIHDSKIEDNKTISYLKVGDLYDELKTSEFYQGLTKANKEKLTKHKFYDYIRANIFFRKFYIERHEGDKFVLKGWNKYDN
jgi:hypothetical protein